MASAHAVRTLNSGACTGLLTALALRHCGAPGWLWEGLACLAVGMWFVAQFLLLALAYEVRAIRHW